jgi:hypothetical protein
LTKAGMPTEVYLWQWVHRLHASQQATGWAIVRNFIGLERSAADFQVALSLYDHLSSTLAQLGDYRQGMSWQSIAQREGCMQIYHFAKHLKGLTENFGGRSPILPSIDRTELRLIWRAFETTLPDWEATRDSVAHHADLGTTPEELSKHALTQPAFGLAGSQSSLLTHTNGRLYSVTYKGRLRTTELSQGTLENLRAIREKVDALLNPALKPFYQPDTFGA